MEVDYVLKVHNVFIIIFSKVCSVHVAQSGRASGSQPFGRGFKSRRVLYIIL